MRAILVFDLPDERSDFNLARDGANWRGVVWDIDQQLRSIIKHDDNVSAPAKTIYQKVRNMITSSTNKRGLNWEE